MARPSPGRGRPGSRHRRLPLAYAIGSVLAVLAWFVAGDTWWVQPLTLSTFWWSLPGLVLCVLALLLGRRSAAVLFAVPALVWVWSYGGLFLPGGFADRGPDLRVASYNTYVKAPSLDSLTGLVERADPDVLLLQEVFPERARRLARALGDTHPHQVAVQSPGVGGVVVASRFPVVGQREVALAGPGSRRTAVVVLEVDGRRLQVVPVHLTSPCPSCGASVTERLDLEARRRHAELAAVLHALDPALPAVIGGDLNSTDRSEPYRMLTRAGFEDPHRAAGSGPGFTWPNDRLWFPVLRIDWVLTRHLDPVDAWVGDGGRSDHRPVLADLAFREEGA